MFALGGNKDFALYRFTLLEVNPKAVEMKFLKLVAKGWSRSADCEVTNQSHQISHEVFLLFSSFELIIFERFMSFILVSFCLIDGWMIILISKWLGRFLSISSQVLSQLSFFMLPFLVKITRRSKTNPAMRTTKQITPMIEYTNAPFAAPDWIVSKNCIEYNIFKILYFHII